jgi:hypothetical protein
MTAPPVVAGNDKFALNFEQVADSCQLSINSFTRESSGTLELGASSEKDPLPEPNVWIGYLPFAMTEDPTNHYAVALYPTQWGPCGTLGSPQLGSYTGSPDGIASTNTWQNMPTVPGGVNSMEMSPSGKLLAISTGTGIQMFHFNGANPITEFTGIIGTSGSISMMRWDTDNHIYALNTSGKLHVYTATTTSVKETAGSPYVIPDGIAATGVIVRSN